jgi:hypothetical protein
MISHLLQLVFGNNNRVAHRDINEFYYNPYPIRFFEQDIKDVIECFTDEIEVIDDIINILNDTYRIDIEKKNELNNLSQECFNHIKENSIIYFNKIDTFLFDPRNEKYLAKYLSTITELNNKIICNRREFDYFDKIFDSIYTYIVQRCEYNLSFDKNLIWIFLHYMYWKCDIGVKYVKNA